MVPSHSTPLRLPSVTLVKALLAAASMWTVRWCARNWDLFLLRVLPLAGVVSGGRRHSASPGHPPKRPRSDLVRGFLRDVTPGIWGTSGGQIEPRGGGTCHLRRWPICSQAPRLTQRSATDAEDERLNTERAGRSVYSVLCCDA